MINTDSFLGEKIELILKKDSSTLVEQLWKSDSGYDDLLNGMLIESEVGVILKIFGNAVNLEDEHENLSDLILKTFRSFHFCTKLRAFLWSIRCSNSDKMGYLPLITSILKYMVGIVPRNVYVVISNITFIIEGSLSRFCNYDESFRSLRKSFKELNSVVEQVVNQCQISFDENVDTICYLSNEQIIPSSDELNGIKLPSLTPAIIVGKYENLEHFLSVHFQLLKEDFIRPLREGLENYKANMTKNLDFIIYNNVKVDSFEYVNDVLYLRFPTNIEITEDSKRFIFGNIFFISYNNFSTIMAATIHDLQYLKRRIIGVKPESNLKIASKDQIFTVIEPKALFIPYRHTLKALKGMSDLPMQDYIVKGQENRTVPDYISLSTRYNLTASQNDISILNSIDFWRSSRDLNLNNSQRRALYGALTRKMAVIQGPPGTGKSFIGLKIVEILLRNKKTWRNGKSSPILVLCYTNHALDQFLEGMLAFTSNICRVGSRSKCRALEACLVKSMRRNYNFLNYSVRPTSRIYSNFTSLEKDIAEITIFLEEMNRPSIVSLSCFASSSIIPSNILSFLCEFSMRAFLSVDFSNQLLFESMGITSDSEAAKDEDTSHKEESTDDSDNESNLTPNSKHHNVYELAFEVTACDLERTIKIFQRNMKKDVHPVIKSYYAEELQNMKHELSNIKELYEIPYDREECKNEEIFFDILPYSSEARWKLYCYWKDKLRDHLQEKRSLLQAKRQKLLMQKNSYNDFLKIDMLKNFDVLGMTTTGATLNLHILHDLDPPIVIIEEAAEVLEAHLVASLPPNCKHLIMIGDHKQLRPKPNVYELAKKYNMDISFFERMIRNGIRYETLECQHRMKPIISDLLVPTIYEKLDNHESVYDYPRIDGMKKDLFFIDHQVYESKHFEKSESFENEYEATFLLGLCSHLLKQGYDSSCITILTPYTGQQRCFYRLRRSESFPMCRDVQIRVLDDYQGEENDIILLSLVRSNDRGKIGFMNIENRINVALSRAKHGMYIMGNMTQMREKSAVWKQIYEKLINNDNIGSELELQCKVHPFETSSIKFYEDFEIKSPNGGCTLPCELSFPSCEHKCPYTCHASHKYVKCKFPCSKLICDQQHPCPKLCFEECGKCKVLINKMLPCGHFQPVMCSTPIENFKCPKLIPKEMSSCKHVIDLECHIDPNSVSCTANCEAMLSCGHQCNRKCHPLYDVNHLQYKCYFECERKPPLCEFNHKCIKKCYQECGTCTVPMDRELKCGHIMNNIECGTLEKDIKCDKKCQRILKCGHVCSSLCGEDCGDCTEIVKKVFPSCNHRIRGTCSVLENIKICPVKCEKLLSCGHICKKTCGEKCGDCMEEIDKIIPECNHIAKVPCSISPSIEYCYGNCTKSLACDHKCAEKCNEPCTSNCENLVENYCSRNHKVLLKCHINQEASTPSFGLTWSKMLIGKYCTEPCKTVLNCGHFCNGNCNDCFNGRLHSSCIETCSKVLVCGHKCKAPCIVDCPPCKTDIIWKCSHREVTQRCGSRKYICGEPCDRRCVHARCTTNCGSECNIEPCTEACAKTLTCGHNCIGVCGEICPSLCRICDKEKLINISNKDNIENLRFVELEDCGHLYEVTVFDKWMKLPLNQQNNDLIVKLCPKCRVPIHNTKRYKNVVSNCYKNVLKNMTTRRAKRKSLNTKKLRNKLEELYIDWPKEVSILLDDLLCCKKTFTLGRYICQEELVLYDFQLKFLEDAQKLKDSLSNNIPYLQELIDRLMQYNIAISKQTIDEIYKELHRVEILFHFEKFRSLFITNKKKAETTDYAKKVLNYIDQSLSSPGFDLNKDSENFMKELLVKLGTVYRTNGLELVFP